MNLDVSLSQNASLSRASLKNNSSPEKQSEGEISSQSKYAFLVGVEDYDEISTLNGPVKDICALREALVSVAGFQPDNISMLARPGSCKNVDSRSPTQQEFIQGLKQFISKVPKGSFLLIAFSGHGLVNNNESYLLLQNSSFDENKRPVKAFKVTELKEIIESAQFQAEHVLILLDACRNTVGENAQNRNVPLEDKFIDSFRFDNLGKRTQSVTVFFSASVGQKSYIRSYEPISYFTWAVIKGLLGEAADAEGQVKIGDLAEYVRNDVPELVRYDFLSSDENQQTPLARFYPEKAKELVIAQVPLLKKRFSYTVEVVLKPSNSSGQFLSHQHADYISQRLAQSIDEMFPLNVIEAKPALAPIKVTYSKADPEKIAEMDYLVRMTFHFLKWHHSFILCSQKPEFRERGLLEPQIKTSFNPQGLTLTIDAQRAFARWGHILGDLLIEAEDNPPKAESKTFTDCPGFVSTRKRAEILPP